MEHIPSGYNWDARSPEQIKKELATEEHILVFDREGATFEDHSYIFEPIIGYKEDLDLIEAMIMRRASRLAELQQKEVSHDGSFGEVMAGLDQQILFVQQQLEFWKHAKTQTSWLFTEAVRRNATENAILGELTDDIEH
ncbi:MAG: hypothetical protein UX49_C0007G0011 [Candidatus Wolfebacteria bacterium GW2011_GWC2_46_275]|uniref:Uncharacterized protein n=2 Tax=Candidatus Wolfeibacteriota TaxID=1752735 RepID=A0A0G1U5S2_9BACT|nr:MAG: hypothetical protein UX70_C0001G0609 [Candidatus Wolfebacteria bacterium GW2011_GWB1_47_1]KKU36852.1 MAG: hypothetical protein UX49_C0007G0011 [Candidatus Wolfebacteria bacterium GW2011_GWC2_46_275]KKU42461.1 MAG: hypothetical protein UX58_C0002G0175 [Candidatus Wolfebacteria bacterium GW2011_GWB2_46_69]KKU54246.1 MAG: hypothetical protein UX76_C0004G0050 [Candidatus Wolfebacteria bacterium GW2011_GWC1_47_103]KKU59614.1 MAG: hypothetical protein UX83_C0003G0029 [Candidatus Wolfebacteria